MAEPEKDEKVVSKPKNPWMIALKRLKGILDEHSFKNWLSHTRFLSLEKGRMVVAVPSNFFADWLNQHYREEIHTTLRECLEDFQDITFKPAPELFGEEIADSPAAPAKTNGSVRGSQTMLRYDKTNRDHEGLNPRYTFNRFVVGAGNRFAHAAARAVAESPHRAYNPLFLYGGTGLGKTHLMQAIGQEILRTQPGCRICLISAEHFMNQLIEGIAKKSTAHFRGKYRKMDVLLVDDIHFITGKEATQEEFFHTFNALFDKHKQIVISSDRQPKEIKGLEDRLLSRFEWGLVTDIQPPDLETRIAILQSKAVQEASVVIEHDALKFIATHITNNIRELEGALIRVMAYSKLVKKNVSAELAEEVLRDQIGSACIRPVTVEEVQRVVAEYFDVRISDLRGRNRQRQVAYPRQIGMLLCKTLINNMSYAEVGEAFGGKDHSTVLYACNKIQEEVKQKMELRQLLNHLEKRIRA